MTDQQSTATVEEREKAVAKKKRKTVLELKSKRLVVGAGARALFYPTLAYNVIRTKLQSDFNWWNQVIQYLLLGAVPFPHDVPILKELGVGAVISLTESFETLVSPSLYKDHNMELLPLPTRDYLYAPSFEDIDRGVDFIHNNASHSITTYVHCKAGRGRSTTIALCYLVKYEQMTPDDAMNLVRLRRPQVKLTSMQTKAVKDYYKAYGSTAVSSVRSDELVKITSADMEGYKESSSNDKARPLVTRISSSIFSLLKVKKLSHDSCAND